MGTRIAGGVLMGILVVYIGFRLAGRQEGKVKAYWHLRQNLEILYSGIERGASLAEALESCTAGNCLMWKNIAETLRQRARESLAVIWTREMEREANPWGLEPEEEEQLLSLGQVLGVQDREQCCRQIRNLQDFLAAQEANRTQKVKEKSLLYRKLGLMAGILVSILLI